MKEKIDINNLLNRIENKDLIRRYIMLIFAVLLYAITYNLFFVNTDLILGGTGGIAILLKKFFTPSLTILVLYQLIKSLTLSSNKIDSGFSLFVKFKNLSFIPI